MVELDRDDRRLINASQGGFPLTERPFRDLGEQLGLSEAEVLRRVRRLVASGALSRFGVVLNPRRMGGDSTLAAVAVPPERLEEAIARINAHPEVSHNYEREHRLNLWFVVSAESEAEIGRVLAEVEDETGCHVLNLPMEQEYFVGVNFQLPE